MRYSQLIIATSALALGAWSPQPDVLPTLQDVEIAGRILHFQDGQPPGRLTVAIVYNGALARSQEEAAALATLLGNGRAVGDLILQPRLVEQAQLAASVGYSAVFSAAGVEDALLRAALKRRPALCLTRHLEQVERGACVVSISSAPSVTIVVNQINAADAGVRFATAFRMMVREI